MNTWYAMQKFSTERRTALLQEAEQRRLLHALRREESESLVKAPPLHLLKGLGVTIGQALRVKFVR